MTRQFLEYHTLPLSGGVECLSVRTFLALSVGGRNPVHHRSLASIATPPVDTAWSQQFRALFVGIVDEFSERIGCDVSAMPLEAARGAQEKLFHFQRDGESAAAIIALDLAVLARIRPGCEWKAPLLGIRNYLADHGIKFYVAVIPPTAPNHLFDLLAVPRRRFIAHQLEAFCAINGIGFVDASRDKPVASGAHAAGRQPDDGLATRIAIALASARIFCNGRFRIGDKKASAVDVCGSAAN